MPRKNKSMTMKFEVLRASDRHAGRVGADTSSDQPCEGAEWNDEQNRWEIELESLEDLENLSFELECFFKVCFPTGRERRDGDLPIIEVLDQDEG